MTYINNYNNKKERKKEKKLSINAAIHNLIIFSFHVRR